MRILTTLILLILLSCRTNHKSLESFKGNEDSSVDSLNKKIKIAQVNRNIIDTSFTNGYLKDPNIDIRIVSYCKGELKSTDDEKTYEFLELITKKNDQYFPINFYIFNHICENSDGALSEILGKFCMEIIVNYPKEVIKHFISHQKDLENYATFLGYEFYFKSKGTSELTMNFQEFKKFLPKNLDLANKKVESTYTRLCVKIDSVMKKVN